MRRTLVLGLLAALALACGGSKADPKVERELTERVLGLEDELRRARGEVTVCKAQLEEAKKSVAAPAGEPVAVVRVEGNVLTITAAAGGGGGSAAWAGNMTAGDQKKLFEAMVAQVRGSRPAIQQCYVAALKKNEAIQARTINLRLLLTVSPSGKVERASFAPDLGADFNGCMAGVTSRWKVPSFSGAAIPVEVPVTLQPAG